MRFFHLSDLHIGLKLQNHDLREDQEYILNQIVEAAAEQKPDAIVIAGDIYDKAIPSAEAVEVFDQFITDLSQAIPEAAVMMISGNHDSASRVNVFRRVLDRHGIYMIGTPPRSSEEYIEKVSLQDSFGPVNFYLLPFVKPSMVRRVFAEEEILSEEAEADQPESGSPELELQQAESMESTADPDIRKPSLTYNDAVHRLIARESVDQTQRNILVSHQFYLPAGTDPDQVERMDSEICTVGNIDAVYTDVLESFDYAALGHIHKPMTAGDARFRYCGTPLACSVSEAGQKKGILQVDIKEKGNLQVSVLPLIPLREVRKIKGTLEEVLTQSCTDYVSVLLTDKVDVDVIDMQDRMRAAFPNLLEIRRETVGSYSERKLEFSEKELDPYMLCCSFLGEPDESEQELLQDVLNAIKENDVQ